MISEMNEIRSSVGAAARVTGLFGSPLALGHILDRIPIGVMILDPKQRTLLYNQTLEVLTGFGLDQVWGVPCRDILRTNLCLHACPARQAMATRQTTAAEGDMISRDRRKIPIRLTAVPIFDTDGVMIGALETVEDLRVTAASGESLPSEYRFGQVLGRSPKMQELFRILPVVAQTDSSVLITGETGAGKDLLAEVIHQASSRKRGPFVKINCGALPETLLESELFGHKKGAFTGAHSDKPGRLRLAHGGTLYLTEIGDLPPALQVKLLTFLDDKVVYPLGGTRGFQADVRVVAATHRNLEHMVREGRFREDLLFRLNVIRLQIPPLRERGDDLILLMDHFVKLFASRFGKRIEGLSPDARRLLAGYAFPGNIRELRNIIEYAANICPDDGIRIEHLPSYLFDAPMPAQPAPDPSSRPPIGSPGVDPRPQEEMDWPSLEKRIILEALARTGGRRSKAADILGWGRSTLWRKMKQYDLG